MTASGCMWWLAPVWIASECPGVGSASTPPGVHGREVDPPHHPDVLPVDVHMAVAVDLERVRPPGAGAAPRLDRPPAHAHRGAAGRRAGLPGQDAARRDLLLRCPLLRLPLRPLRGGVPHQT